MRITSGCLLALVLAGCTGGSGAPDVNTDSPMLQTAFGLVGLATQMVSPRYGRLQRTAAEPMIVRVEDRDTIGQFLLESTRDGYQTWIAADDTTLILRDGILTGTRGLGGDMMSSDVAQSAALILAAQNGQVERFHGFLDGNDQVELRSFICDIESRGARDIDVGTGPIQTTLMQERCVNPDVAFQNLYWVTPTGIVQSRQWAGGFSGSLAIRTRQ